MIQVIPVRMNLTLEQVETYSGRHLDEDCCTRIETLTRHFPIIDGIAQYYSQVEEDSTPLVEDLDARLDLEVFAHGNVQRM